MSSVPLPTTVLITPAPKPAAAIATASRIGHAGSKILIWDPLDGAEVRQNSASISPHRIRIAGILHTQLLMATTFHSTAFQSTTFALPPSEPALAHLKVTGAAPAFGFERCEDVGCSVGHDGYRLVVRTHRLPGVRLQRDEPDRDRAARLAGPGSRSLHLRPLVAAHPAALASTRVRLSAPAGRCGSTLVPWTEPRPTRSRSRSRRRSSPVSSRPARCCGRSRSRRSTRSAGRRSARRCAAWRRSGSSRSRRTAASACGRSRAPRCGRRSCCGPSSRASSPASRPRRSPTPTSTSSRPPSGASRG